MSSIQSAHAISAGVSPAAPFQFTLRRMMALLISVGVLLGMAPYGVWPVLTLGLSLACFLFVVTASKPTLTWRRWYLTLPTWGVLIWLISIRSPIEGTWLSLAGFALWGLWIAIRLPVGWSWILQLLLAWQLLDDLVSGRLPVPCCSVGEVLILDVQAGRTRLSAGTGLTFATPSPATVVIEKYLGPTSSVWRKSRWDFNESSDEYWESRDPDLAEWGLDERCVAMLPHDEARRQVLAAITCDGSLVRVDQLQLLCRLFHQGYPPGHNAESWWKAHAWVFVPERDPAAAQAKTRGWRPWMTHAYDPWYRAKNKLPKPPMGIDWWPPIPIPTEEELSGQ